MTAADAGTKLRELREAAGVSIADLAETSGYTPRWLKSLERGRATRASTLRQVGQALATVARHDPDTVVDLLLEAAGGDHLPEAPDGQPTTPHSHGHRQAVAAERRRSHEASLRERIAELERDPDALIEWVRDVTGGPDRALARAADLLDGPSGTRPVSDTEGTHRAGGGG